MSTPSGGTLLAIVMVTVIAVIAVTVVAWWIRRQLGPDVQPYLVGGGILAGLVTGTLAAVLTDAAEPWWSVVVPLGTAALGGLIVQVVGPAVTRAEQRAEAAERDRVRAAQELAAKVSYLDWLLATNSSLPVRGLGTTGELTVELDRVYVALRVDSRTTSERRAAAALLHRYIEEARHGVDLGPAGEEHDRFFVAASVQPDPELLSGLGESGHYLVQDPPYALTISEMCRRTPAFVMLGDPGTGKTTVMRWLALTHARALRDDARVVTVPAAHVDAAASSDSPAVDLGSPLLPVPVRITEFAEHNRRRVEANEPPRTLLEYLGRQGWEGRRPVWRSDVPDSREGERIPEVLTAAIVGQAIADDQALVILDGLDEVPAASRHSVAVAVTELVDALGMRYGRAEGGNQVIVTSRVVGYDLAPLPAELTHVTVEKMNAATREQFIRHWMSEVLRRWDEGPSRAPARARADQLLALLATPEERYANELATNPLLASVIVSVFLRGGGTLPPQRIELYQAAVDALVDVWAARTSDRDLNDDRNLLFNVLPGIAAYVHESKPNGVISGPELTSRLVHEISRLLREDPEPPSLEATRLADDALRAMREGAGLIVESGTNAFKFSHLTFQEYLTARHLAFPATGAADRIRDHLGDPRWHEPILMAISLIHFHAADGTKEFVDSLLETRGPLDDLFPETALLLAEAFAQTLNVPSSSLRAVATMMLQTYVVLTSTERLEQIRSLIESSFAQLREQGYGQDVDQVWGDALTEPWSTDAACATARLIRNLDVTSDHVAERLLAALDHDRPELDSPIADALLGMVSPPRVQTIGSSPSDRLDANWSRQQLPMRVALSEQPELVERIRSDPQWLALMICLYGGYADLDAHSALTEFRLRANFLQLDDEDRKPYEILYGLRYNFPDDPVLRMAEHLDTVQSWYRERWDARPRFDVGAITRDTPLTRDVLRALQRDDLDGLRETLRRHAGCNELTRRADALVGLWALGDDITRDVESSDDVAVAVRRRVGALRTTLRDAAVRAAPAAAPTLSTAAADLDYESWERLLSAASAVVLDAGSNPIEFSDHIADLPERAQIKVLSEEMTHRISGWGDDALYNAAVFGDTFHARAYPASALVAALHMRGTAHHHTYDLYQSPWPADPLALSYGEEDIPISVVDQIMRIPKGMTWARVWALRDVCRPLLDTAPSLLPELQAAAWTTIGHEGVNDGDMPALLTETLVASPDPGRALAQAAQAVENAWHRARAQLRVAEVFADHRGTLRQQALASADEVTDARHAFELHQRFAMLSDRARDRHIAECSTLVEELRDPVDAARARLRLARLRPEARDDFVTAALDDLRAASGNVRAGLLRLILRDYADGAGARTRVEELVDGSLEDVETELAMAQWGDILLRHRRHLMSSGPDAVQTWTPVEVYARANQLALIGADTRRRRAWNELAERPSVETVTDVIATHDTAAIICSGRAARTIEHGRRSAPSAVLEPLLRSLVQLTPDAEPIVRSWLEGHSHAAAEVAALLIGETAGLTAEVATPLTALLDHPDDLMRYRASRILCHPSVRSHPSSASMVGSAAIERLVEMVEISDTIGPVSPGAVLAVKWALEGLLLDDPAMVETWCRQAASNSPRVAPAILRHLHWMTDPVWSTAISALRSGNPAVMVPLIVSASRMLFRSSTDVTTWSDKARQTSLRMNQRRWEELQGSLRTLDPGDLAGHDAAPLTAMDAASAAVAALKHSDGKATAAAVAFAGEHLERSCGMSLADLVTDPDPLATRRRMYAIGRSYTFVERIGPDVRDLLATEQVDPTRQHWEWEPFLLQWARELLSETVVDDPLRVVRSCVLEVLAVAADLNPNALLVAADEIPIRDQLIDVAVHHNSFPGRAAAIHVLGVLRYGSPPVLNAMKGALRDVYQVRNAALAAIPRLRDVDQTVVASLIEALQDESGTTAWSAAQLLTAIGRSPSTPSVVRNRIIEALAAAVRSPRSRRTVYFSYVESPIPQMPALDDVLANALRQVYRLG